MASSFNPQLSAKHEGYTMRYFTPSGTIKAFDIVYFDTADNTVKAAAADGALILGIAQCPSSESWLYEGRIPVAVLTHEILLGLASATTPAAAHIGREYGFAIDAGGNYVLDIAETIATRFVVAEIDSTNGIFFVHPLAANLQGDAVAS